MAYYTINSASVVHDVLDGEAVMINLDTGNYYTLNASGALLWSLLESGASEEHLAAALKAVYPHVSSQIENDLAVYIKTLHEQKLIIVASNQGEVTESTYNCNESESYEAPKLEIFTDMQELLLLDPIHEIDQRGWPYTDAS